MVASKYLRDLVLHLEAGKWFLLVWVSLEKYWSRKSSAVAAI